MHVIETVREMREWVRREKNDLRAIGFVPTLGCLHEGHRSLLAQAGAVDQRVVLSVFVNPLQFQSEAFEQYPRRLTEDLKIADESAVDAVFTPPVDEMFGNKGEEENLFAVRERAFPERDPERFQNDTVGSTNPIEYIRSPSRLIDRMDGANHPWHFDGVTTVVKKLIDIIEPDRAYFGKKDVQQTAILRAMFDWLGTKTRLESVAVIRDADGLSSSSRLILLSKAQRDIAVNVLNSVIRSIKSALDKPTDIGTTKESFYMYVNRIRTEGHNLRVEKFDAVDPMTLGSVRGLSQDSVVYVAYTIDGIRLAESIWLSDELPHIENM